MNIEELYPLVSDAIRRAEALEELGAPGTRSAYQDVSLLEEKVAEILPASDPEGALARRGAVRGALAAKELARARRLSERFLAEVEEDAELRAELLHLSEQAELQVQEPVPEDRPNSGVPAQEDYPAVGRGLGRGSTRKL